MIWGQGPGTECIPHMYEAPDLIPGIAAKKTGNFFRGPSCHCVPTGGCIDDTILSRQGFLNYAKLPTLDMAQGELVGRLSGLMAQTHALLQHQPLQLTAMLDQHVKQQPKEDPVGTAEEQPAPSAAPES